MAARVQLDIQTMTAPKESHERISIVETRLDGIENTLRDVVTALREIAGQPKTIAWREILVTAGAVLGICAYAGSFLEAQDKKNSAPLEQRVQMIERAMGNQLLLGFLQQHQK
jgi:hypothetical protein